MTLAGSAVGAALSNIKGELELEAVAVGQAQKLNNSSNATSDRRSADITHHFKMTHTESVEIDETSKDESDKDHGETKTKSKSKRAGCFSRCFGKKG